MTVTITCHLCHTRYAIEDTAIPAAGRLVKCMKCRHSWHQEKPIAFEEEPVSANSADTPPEPPHSPRLITSPMYIRPAATVSSTPLWLKGLPVLLIIAIMITLAAYYKERLLFYVPQLQPLYELIGDVPTQNFHISNMSVKKVIAADATNIYVRASITNDANVSQSLPLVQMSIRDKENNMIGTTMMKNTGQMMQAGETLMLENTIPHMTEDMAYVVLEIGNWRELLTR